MSSDEVTTSGSSDGKKSSKPIMEKRRRARINASLVELKSLLMDVIKSEGAIHSKMEKADILEMTVRHLRALQNQHFPSETTGFRGFESIVGKPGKFSLGYTECISEVGKFLNSLDVEEIDLKTKIIDHLANSVTRTRTSDVDIDVTMTSLESPMMRGKPLSSFGSIPIAPQPVAMNVDKSADGTEGNNRVSGEENRRAQGQQISNVQYIIKDNRIQYTPIVSGSVSKPIPIPLTGSAKEEAGSKSTPISGNTSPTKAQVSYSPAFSHHSPVVQQKQVVDLQTLRVSESSPQAYPKFSVSPIPTQLFSGLQIVPTTLAGNEVAFVVPANLLTSTGNVFATMAAAQSYVLPVYKMDVDSNTSKTSAQPETSLSQVSEITSSDNVTTSKPNLLKQCATKSPTSDTCIATSVTQRHLMNALAPTNLHCVSEVRVSCNETRTSGTQRNETCTSLTQHNLVNTHGNQPYDLSKRPLHTRSLSTSNTSVTHSESRSNLTAGNLRTSKEITPKDSVRNSGLIDLTRTSIEATVRLKQEATSPRLLQGDTNQNLNPKSSIHAHPSCSDQEYSQSASDREHIRGPSASPSASDNTSSDDVWRPW